MKIITSTINTKWSEGILTQERATGDFNLKLDPKKWDENGSETANEFWGFGGCFNELGKIGLDTLDKDEVESLMDLLFGEDSELKFDFCRLPIGASDYAASWYSFNETDGDYEMKNFSIERDKKCLIPYIKMALKRNSNLKLFASPWSPPTWMKHPPVYNYGRLIESDVNLKAYALYLVKFVQEYAQEGIHIDQLHVQNEVCADQKFPSCLWSPELLAKFIGKYLGPAFAENNIDTEIWLGTLNGRDDFDTMAFPILNDTDASKYIKGVAYQWDGKTSIARNVECFPEIPVIQSENECGDGQNTWSYAKYVFNLMRHYINAGARAYVYWNMFLNTSNGLSTWGWSQNSLMTVVDGEVTKNHEYYVMRHLAQFAGAGSVPMSVSGRLSGMTIAFENESNYVFAINNPLNEKITLKLQIGDVSYTSVLEADSISTVVIEK